MSLRIAVLGWGAIGRAVAGHIAAAAERGDDALRLTAVASRFSRGVPDDLPASLLRGGGVGSAGLVVDPDDLGAHADVVVEAAGADALRAYGPGCISAGADLLVVSLGALLDEDFRHALESGGPGRLVLCSGAIGGLDLVAAAHEYGPIERITLHTTKPSATLLRDWMDADLKAALVDGTGPVECLRGGVAEAVRCFPESLNVSAALALAAGSTDAIEVVVTGSPTATTNTHDITMTAAAGDYRFSITNRPSPDNPRTSHVTAWAVVRSLRVLAGTPGVFV